MRRTEGDREEERERKREKDVKKFQRNVVQGVSYLKQDELLSVPAPSRCFGARTCTFYLCYAFNNMENVFGSNQYVV